MDHLKKVKSNNATGLFIVLMVLMVSFNVG
jgi:hypothetical protein